MNKNQHHLANNLKVSGNCPISSLKLDDLIDAALEIGVFGAKVTGSGGARTQLILERILFLVLYVVTILITRS